MASSHNLQFSSNPGIEPYPDDKALAILGSMLDAIDKTYKENESEAYGIQVAINIINGEGDPITVQDVNFAVAIIKAEISTLRLQETFFKQNNEGRISELQKTLETIIKKVNDATEPK